MCENVRETLLISACLMGVRCRYDGGGQAMARLDELMERYVLVPVCPEVLGGLPTPREPAELRGERVVTRTECDVTDAFRRGAAEAARIARACGCSRALLKERSPSCGCGKVYDGTFCGVLREGSGLCAQALLAQGVRVLGESRAEEWLE